MKPSRRPQRPKQRNTKKTEYRRDFKPISEPAKPKSKYNGYE